MTIYTCKGFETNRLIEVESDTDDFETIVNSKVIKFDDVSSIESIKRHKAYYFIAGELSEPTRKNDNVLSKTLVTLDFDDLILTEEEFKAHLMNKISALKFLAYPSISNGLKGTRYRVIIPTDRPYTNEESTTVIQFITDHIGLPYDAASETWSQLQGLKTTFESVESFEGKCIHNKGMGVLKVDNSLQKMKERKASSRKKSDKRKSSFTVNYTRNRTFTSEFLERLLQPIEDGERNVKMTSLIGKLFSLGVEPNSVYEWAHLINDNFVVPALEEEEVNKIFRSILKAEKQKLERGG